MIPARVTLWFLVYICILCNMFSTNNMNIAIVTMVKYSEVVAENIAGVCNHRKVPLNNTYVQNTGIYASNSQTTFEWSKADRNLVLGALNAFPWISPFLGGYLSHKYGTKLVTGWCTFIACAASSGIPFVANVGPILVAIIRGIQGIIMSIGQPAGIYSIAGKWYPIHERGKFLTVFSSFSVGPALAFSIFGFISDFFGWPYVFHATSLFGCLWFIGWQYLMYDTPDKHPRISAKEKSYIQKELGSTVAPQKLPVPWKAIFTSMPFLVNVICQVGATHGRIIFLMYMPTYFKVVHGLSAKDNGLICGTPYLFRAVFVGVISVVLDIILQKKILSQTGVRKLATFISSILSGIVLIGVAFAECNTPMAVIFISISIIMNGAFSAGAAIGTVDMSPNFCSVLTGIAMSVSLMSGILIPFEIAWISNFHEIDILAQWKTVWLTTGAIYVITGLIYVLWSNSELQPWNTVYHEPSDEKLLDKLGRPKSKQLSTFIQEQKIH